MPIELRRAWTKSNLADAYSDIFEIEAIGPLVVLETWPHLLRECLWIHFIDNNAALATMVRGSSSVASGDVINGMTWERVAKLRCRPWFERVESSANPVDGLSRGRRDGDWDIVPLRIPADLRRLLRKEQS